MSLPRKHVQFAVSIAPRFLHARLLLILSSSLRCCSATTRGITRTLQLFGIWFTVLDLLVSLTCLPLLVLLPFVLSAPGPEPMRGVKRVSHIEAMELPEAIALQAKAGLLATNDELLEEKPARIAMHKQLINDVFIVLRQGASENTPDQEGLKLNTCLLHLAFSHQRSSSLIPKNSLDSLWVRGH